MNKKRKIALVVGIAVILIAVTLAVVFLEVLASPPVYRLARIACLGDSITQETGYPEDLQALLGSGSVVGNYGSIGASVNLNSDLPYYYEPPFRSARRSSPTTVVIMLGTNDAHDNIYQYIDSFVGDYERIIRSVQSVGSKPQIFLVLPPPVFDNTIGVNGTIYAQEVIPRIQQVGNQTGLPLIDVYTPMLNYSQYFPDGVHPDGAGAQIIAQIIYEAIKS